MKKKKRTWCYSQYPAVYEVLCDKCGGTNTSWSEYEHHIWCFDCKKDVKGTEGIFGGPVPIEACHLMGIRFDRIDLKTFKLIKEEEYMNKGKKK